MKQQLKDMSTCLLLATCLLMATACTGRSARTGDDKKEAKPVITVTLEPQRYFTEAIAGNKFDVVSMVPKGSSPETYDPIPQQLVSLGNSKAYFRIGYIGFEQAWMDRLMDNTPHIQVFDTSKGIDLILNNDEHGHAHGHGGHDSHVHAVEPHVWNSTGNALIIAGNTYKALARLDKDNEAYYRNRHDSLCLRIQRTDSLIRQRLSAPGAAKAFMIYHPALSYFARDYGLHQISIEEGGKEPSPAHLKELIDLCRTEEVSVIFVQPEFDKRNAETIAQQTGTKVVPINPLSYDWEKEMLNVAEALGGKEENGKSALLSDNPKPADTDTTVYELPQCSLWYTKELPPMDAREGRMWTEHKRYREDVVAINLFVANPTPDRWLFGRDWQLQRWDGAQWSAPKQKEPLFWNSDGFTIDKAPLLYCFRIPVGEYYYLPKGKYRITKHFKPQEGKNLELTAEFEI